jgi:hypothetical protein
MTRAVWSLLFALFLSNAIALAQGAYYRTNR